MNILELQEDLKDLPDRRLIQEMQMPTGAMPQFLVLSELTRRKRMRNEYKRQAAADTPTVAEEVVAGAGVPQEGLMAMAGAMAPNTNVAQDTGLTQAMPMQATRAPQPMADGGIMRLNQGSALSLEDLRALKEYRRQLGVTDPNVLTSIAAEDPFNPMTQFTTKKFGNVDLMQIASMLQRGANRDGLVANFGADAVREAESMLSDHSYLSIGQLPLGMGGQFGTISKRELRQRPIKSYRDPSQSTYLGGESIQNVPANIESFIPELENPYEEQEDIYDTLALDTAQAPELEDPYAEPEDPLRPKTGFGSNPAYTYETFLEENGLNDVPEAQEMFIRYKDYMNERGPTSDPKVYSPFLDSSPELKSPPDSGKPPTAPSSMDEEFIANTLFPEGMGTALQEFNKQRNAGFGDGSGDFEPIPYLSSISNDAEQRALEESYAEQRENRSLSNQLKGGLDSTAAIVGDILTPDPLLEVGAVPNKREVLESKIADINQQILDAEQANDEILVGTLTKRKNALMRSLDVMEFSEDAGEVLRNVPSALQDVGSSIYQTFNDLVVAGVDPRLAAANIKASQDAVAARELENEVGIESEAEREARIEALRGGAAKVVPGISTDVSGFFPDLEMENPNIGDSTTPAPIVTTDDDPNKKLPVTDPDPEGFGSTDSRIAKMLSERQKQAESDKWMALAQAGFKMMTSKSPTLLGAVGEGGEAGLKALSASKKGLRDFETDMLKLETQLAAARLRSKGSTKMAPAALVTAAASRLRTARDTLDNAVSPVEKQNALDAYNAALEEYNNINAFVASQYGYTPSSSTGVGNNVPNLGDSANQSANQ